MNDTPRELPYPPIAERVREGIHGIDNKLVRLLNVFANSDAMDHADTWAAYRILSELHAELRLLLNVANDLP